MIMGRPRTVDNMTNYAILEDGCWAWLGHWTPKGYGQTSREINGTRLAYRAIYIETHGRPASGLVLDHLCGKRCCVNPDHLEPVTQRTNIRRGHANRTLCRNNLHPLPHGTSQCRPCRLISYSRYDSKRKKA